MRTDLIIVIAIVGALVVLPIAVLVVSRVCCGCLNACSEDIEDRRRRRRRRLSAESSTSASTEQLNPTLREKIALVEGHDRLVRETGVRLDDYPFIPDYEPIIVIPRVHAQQRAPVPAPRTVADGGEVVARRPLPSKPDSDSSSARASVSSSSTSSEDEEHEVTPLLAAAAPIYAVPSSVKNQQKPDHTVIEMQEIQTNTPSTAHHASSQASLSPSPTTPTVTEYLPHVVVPVSEFNLDSPLPNPVPVEEKQSKKVDHPPVPPPRSTSTKEEKETSFESQPQLHSSNDPLSSDSSYVGSDDGDSSSLNESDLEDDGSLSDSSSDSSESSRSSKEVSKPKLPVRRYSPYMVKEQVTLKSGDAKKPIGDESSAAVYSSSDSSTPPLINFSESPQQSKMLDPANSESLPNYDPMTPFHDSTASVHDSEVAKPLSFRDVTQLPEVRSTSSEEDKVTSEDRKPDSIYGDEDSQSVQELSTSLNKSNLRDEGSSSDSSSDSSNNSQLSTEAKESQLPVRRYPPYMVKVLPSEFHAMRKSNDARKSIDTERSDAASSPSNGDTPHSIDFSKPHQQSDVKETINIETSPNCENHDSLFSPLTVSDISLHDSNDTTSVASGGMVQLPVVSVTDESPATHEFDAEVLPQPNLGTHQPVSLLSRGDEPLSPPSSEDHSPIVGKNEFPSSPADKNKSEMTIESVEPLILVDELSFQPNAQKEDEQPISATSSFSPVDVHLKESHSLVDIDQVKSTLPTADTPLFSPSNESMLVSSIANKEETSPIQTNSDESSDSLTDTSFATSEEKSQNTSPPGENVAVARPVTGPVLTQPPVRMSVSPVLFETAMEKSTSESVDEKGQPNIHSSLKNNELCASSCKSEEDSSLPTFDEQRAEVLPNDERKALTPPFSTENTQAHSTIDQQSQLLPKTAPVDLTLPTFALQQSDDKRPVVEEDLRPSLNINLAEPLTTPNEAIEISEPPMEKAEPVLPTADMPILIENKSKDAIVFETDTKQPASLYSDPEKKLCLDQPPIDTTEKPVPQTAYEMSSEDSLSDKLEPLATEDVGIESSEAQFAKSEAQLAEDKSVAKEIASEHDKQSPTALEPQKIEERPRESITDDVFGAVSGAVEEMFTTSPFPVAAQFMATPRANTDFVSGEEDNPSPMLPQKEVSVSSDPAKTVLETPSDLPASSSMIGQLVEAVEDLFAPNPTFDNGPSAQHGSLHAADATKPSSDSIITCAESLPPVTTTARTASAPMTVTPSHPPAQVSPNITENEGAYEPSTLLARPRARLPLLVPELPAAAGEDGSLISYSDSSDSLIHSPSTDVSGDADLGDRSSASNSDNNAYE
ncbi:mucin-17-like [Watersipora subatra]|uniref:mucin-17-like n=1 Tax=Watersipora subatra TaxID=2589382 RepID=UPI00355B19DC